MARIAMIHFKYTAKASRLRSSNQCNAGSRTMNVLIVYAHPGTESLNASLRDFAVGRLEAKGHAVRVSDLYSMGWKPTLDTGDFPERDATTPLDPMADSEKAFREGTQSDDIAAEQEKLQWADAVIFQFPLWWFTMPAILKGWFDRVYAFGFAYGVGEHSDRRWGERYGEGRMAGKRAMLMVTTGGWESHYGERGVNGPMEDILFPIQHGMLYYPGFSVLPPFVAYRVGHGLDAAGYDVLAQRLGQRLDELATAAPLPFRAQNGGDYEIPSLTLRDEIAPGVTGFAAHRVPQPA
jgi:NAD(P)H dehydrogenase (quinone)